MQKVKRKTITAFWTPNSLRRGFPNNFAGLDECDPEYILATLRSFLSAGALQILDTMDLPQSQVRSGLYPTYILLGVQTKLNNESLINQIRVYVRMNDIIDDLSTANLIESIFLT
jgi:hypothetical protein